VAAAVDCARRNFGHGPEITWPLAGRVDELLWQSGFSADCDAGRYRGAAAIRAQVRRITGYGGSDQHLDAAWCSAFRPDPDVIELLGRHRGGRRGVFTNKGRWKRRS
jgi:putative hydrolase of the HAD superfamily